MFTGLIEETGVVLALTPRGRALTATYKAELALEGTVIGDSISVNGICQTVTELKDKTFSTEISGETIGKTNAGSMKPGDSVNLERAMALGDRLGGHLVQGHVNGRGSILSIDREGDMYRMTIRIPQELMKFMIDEGSVAVDGISLTIASTDRSSGTIQLQIIPHTFEHTNLSSRKKGEVVNIETDMLGRYVENLLIYQRGKSITENQLKQWGYER